MKKFMLLFVAVIVAIIAFFGVKSLRTSSDTNLAAYVPADTALFASSKTEAKAWEAFAKMPIDASQLVPLQEELQRNMRDSQSDAKGDALVLSLLGQLIDNVSTYGDFVELMGMDAEAGQVFYLEGAYPVMRGGLKDAQVFEQFWNQVLEEAGTQWEEKASAADSSKHYQQVLVGQSATGVSLYLAIAHDEKHYVVTLLNGSDSAARIDTRLGFVKPTQSLADTTELDDVRKVLDIKGQDIGFISLSRLSRGLMRADDSLLSADINTLVEQFKMGRKAEMSQVCKDEIGQLVDTTPRLSFGTTIDSVSSDKLSLSTRVRLESSATLLLDMLEAVKGHLSTSHNDDAIFSMGLGLNVAELFPQVTKVIGAIQQQSFQCPQLQQLQRQAQNMNPQMAAGVIMGVADGVKGLSASLFDVATMEEDTAQGTNDFLITLASEKPATQVNMFNMMVLPNLLPNAQPVPTDGSEAVYDLGMLFNGLTFKAGVKGQHIVIFNGEKATQVANNLKDEKLDANGLYGMYVDYMALNDVLTKMPSELVGASNHEMCKTTSLLRAQLARSPMKLAFSTNSDAKGLVMDSHIELNLKRMAQALNITPEGRYVAADACDTTGKAMGYFEFNQDGTGVSEMLSYNGECVRRKADVQWSVKGAVLSMDLTNQQRRSSCDAQWQSSGNDDSLICTMTGVANGFDCSLPAESNQTIAFRPAAQ